MSFPFLLQLSVGRNQVIRQIFLEVVIIINALHAPDHQLLTQDVIHRRNRREGEKYLNSGVEIFHYLSCGDPTFEAVVLLNFVDFGVGWFSAQIPTEEHSGTRLFPGIDLERVVHPIVFYLPARTHWIKGT